MLITIFLVTYRIYTWYGDSAHKSVKTSKTYRIPAINLPKAFPGKRTDRKDAKPEEAPSGKTSQSTKKNQQVRFRLSRDGVSSNDTSGTTKTDVFNFRDMEDLSRVSSNLGAEGSGSGSEQDRPPSSISYGSHTPRDDVL